MTRAIFLAPLLLAACAADEGRWPSLARRPGEGGAPIAQPAEALTVPEASYETPPAPGVVAAADARLIQASTDLESTAARWQRQRQETDAAIAQARGMVRNAPAWSRGQLELTRLEKVGAQLEELRQRLDAVSGDLAAAAAGGVDVTASLRRAGALIARVDALTLEHDRAFTAADAALQR